MDGIYFEKLAKLRAAAAADNVPVLREQSFALLCDIVTRLQPSSILEIGTSRGLSGVAMLLCAQRAFLTGVEIDENAAKTAKFNYKEFGVDGRAKIFIGDAGEIVPVLTGEYDFIFLDGPKGHYFEYLPHLISNLKVGGTLFADNVLFRGYVRDQVKTPHRFATTKHSMQKFLDAVCHSDNFQTELYDFEDGVSITRKLGDCRSFYTNAHIL